MKIKEFWSKLNDICPENLAEDWDNSGPQMSFYDDEISGIFVALEVTFRVIERAAELGCNAIVTHHPLFFDKTSSCINPEFTVGKYAKELIKKRISVYSAHTDFDKMRGGNNDYFGEFIRASDIKFPDDDEAIYRVGTIPEIKISNLIKKLSEAFNVPENFIHTVGNMDSSVSKIGWCTGSGMDFIYPAWNDGAQVFITGDVKYHDARDAHERGMAVIDIGHYPSERIFSENMTGLLRNDLGLQLSIFTSDVDTDPFQ